MTKKKRFRGKLQSERHDRKGGWEHSHNWISKQRGRAERLRRSGQVGSNDRYYYSVGHNHVELSGRVMRWPKAGGLPNQELVWFRLAVPNQDRRNQWLFIPVRCSGALGFYAYSNIGKGDIVAVLGRIYSARMPIESEDEGVTWKQFTYLIAEKIGFPHPVLIEKDPRYVRVRVDLFNRLCSLSKEMEQHRIPLETREEMGLEEPLENLPGYSAAEFEVDQDEHATDLTNLEPDPESDKPEDTVTP